MEHSQVARQRTLIPSFAGSIPAAPAIPAMLLLLLIGCQSGLTSVEQIRLDGPVPSLTVPCAMAVRLPDRMLTQSEVEKYWIKDRYRLSDCRGKHDELVEWSRMVVEAVE